MVCTQRYRISCAEEKCGVLTSKVLTGSASFDSPLIFFFFFYVGNSLCFSSTVLFILPLDCHSILFVGVLYFFFLTVSYLLISLLSLVRYSANVLVPFFVSVFYPDAYVFYWVFSTRKFYVGTAFTGSTKQGEMCRMRLRCCGLQTVL